MADLLRDTAINTSRSVAATASAALARLAGTPEAQALGDAQQNLDVESIAQALEVLGELDPSLGQALAARRRLASQIEVIE
jgi:hypothetical protein